MNCLPDRHRSMVRLISILIALSCAAQAQLTNPSGRIPQAVALSPEEVSTTTSGTPSLFHDLFFVDVGSLAEAIVAADLDGNGYPDIVTAIQTNSTNNGIVSVATQDARDYFHPTINYSSGAPWAQAVAVADLNHDGKPDIVVANYGSLTFASIGVLMGNGDGTFQDAVLYTLPAYDALSVVIADLNHDGKPDVIVGGFMHIVILFGNGDGTFQSPVSLPAAPQVYSLAVADVNGDGNLDLVAATNQGITVLLGKGDGTFPKGAFYPSGFKPGGAAYSVALADLNGDGYPDIAVANFPDGTVGVLLNRGNGKFSPVVTYDTGGPNTDSVAIGDLTGDLKPDLVAVGNSAIAIFPGNGDGTFESPLVFTIPYPADNKSVAIIDSNLDRKPDLMVLDGGSFVNVLINGLPSLATTTTLVASPNPSLVGQTVTFTATVSSSKGPPPRGELVTFSSSTGLLGTAPLIAGSASLSVNSLAVGDHHIRARYPGDSDFLRPSPWSPLLTQVVDSH
jgi:Bacterial Ig-like domain (group 3)/FG-GAP-like repeat